MADFQFDRLYGVTHNIIKYQQETQLPMHNQKGQIFITPTGQYVRRYRTVVNKVLSFWFYRLQDSVKTYDNLINTVNKSQICLGDYIIKPGKALMRNIQKRRVPVLQQTSATRSGQVSVGFQKKDAYKIYVQLQIQVQKSVLYQQVPMMGYFFKDSDNKLKRIQRLPCSTAENGATYGYGFFLQNRPDLDVPHKMFLKEDGSIAFKVQDVHILRYKIHKEMQWNGLQFPKVQGVDLYG